MPRSFVLLLLLCGSRPAMAADVTITTSAAIASDSNLFRVPAATRMLLPHGGSDVVKLAQATFGIESIRSTSALAGHATINRSWFAHNGPLDNTGYDVGGSARYLGVRGSIEANGARARRLVSFEDIRSGSRSIQTIDSANLLVSRAVIGDIRAIAGGNYQRSVNSDPTIGRNDYRRINYTVGLGYYSPAGNIAAVQGRVVSSRGLNDRSALIGGQTILYRASFVERSIEARLLYVPSVLCRIDGRIGYTRHRDDSAVAGDFGGLTGDATLTLSPRRAVRITLRATRQYDTSSGVFSNGVRVERLAINATGEASETVSVTVSADRSSRDFRYDVQSTTPLVEREERIGTMGASIDYHPSSSWKIQLTGSRGQRTSSDSRFRYRDTLIALSGTFGFGTNRAASIRSGG